MWVSDKCDVLLVFVNDNEKDAVYTVFKDKYKRQPGKIFSDPLVYHDFGEIGGARIMGLQIEMGSAAPGGSAPAITTACIEKSPQYVILVGIAFGMDTKKQPIGDILVSRKLSLYEIRRIGTNKDGEDIEIKRGDSVTAPTRILQKLKALSGEGWEGAVVRFGQIISGEKLIDNPKFKAKLQEDYPEAIGGEMEAAGAYAAAELHKRDWIVVKAVCDHADGKKGKNKKRRQQIASTNAALFVFHVLENGEFGGISNTARRSGTESKEKEAVRASRSLIIKRVKRNISGLLAGKPLKCFYEALIQLLNEENNEETQYEIAGLTDILVKMDLLEAISLLERGLIKCIKDIPDSAAVNRTWDDCVAVVCWLVLLGVEDDWADEKGKVLSDKKGEPDLVISAETEVGADIAFKRLKATRVYLYLDEKSMDVKSKTIFPSDKYRLESGIHPMDWVLVIKTALYKYLIPLEKTVKVPSGEKLNDELNQTLWNRAKKGEYHYIAVNPSAKDDPLHDKKVYEQLKKDVPNLDIFFLGSEERGMAAIIGESRLHAQLREFFRNKPKEDKL
jgi:nucleoside phosphorylase